MLAVDPKHQKYGAGRLLIEWCCKAAIDNQINGGIYLEASISAESFYHHLGFRTVKWDEVSDFRAPNGSCKWPCCLRLTGIRTFEGLEFR